MSAHRTICWLILSSIRTAVMKQSVENVADLTRLTDDRMWLLDLETYICLHDRDLLSHEQLIDGEAFC